MAEDIDALIAEAEAKLAGLKALAESAKTKHPPTELESAIASPLVGAELLKKHGLKKVVIDGHTLFEEDKS